MGRPAISGYPSRHRPKPWLPSRALYAPRARARRTGRRPPCAREGAVLGRRMTSRGRSPPGLLAGRPGRWAGCTVRSSPGIPRPEQPSPQAAVGVSVGSVTLDRVERLQAPMCERRHVLGAFIVLAYQMEQTVVRNHVATISRYDLAFSRQPGVEHALAELLALEVRGQHLHGHRVVQSHRRLLSLVSFSSVGADLLYGSHMASAFQARATACGRTQADVALKCCTGR